MTSAERMRDFGREPRSGRRLLHLRLEVAADCPRPLRLPTPRALVLVVWDAEDEPVAALAGLTEALLEAGCVYLCAWGRDCERVHDVFHETIVGDGEFDIERAPTASWHAGDSLDEALWFALTCAEPDEALAQGCGTLLVLEVGADPERSAAIERALTDPEDLVERVLASES